MEFLATYFDNSPLLLAFALLGVHVLSTMLFFVGAAAKNWFISGRSNLKLIGSNVLISVLAIAGIILLHKEILFAGSCILVIAYFLLLIRLGVRAEMNCQGRNWY